MGKRLKRHEEWGLKPLTFKEAGRILGVTEDALKFFVGQYVKKVDPSQKSRWESGKRPLPDYVFRAFVYWRAGGGDMRDLIRSPEPPLLGPGPFNEPSSREEQRALPE